MSADNPLGSPPSGPPPSTPPGPPPTPLPSVPQSVPEQSTTEGVPLSFASSVTTDDAVLQQPDVQALVPQSPAPLDEAHDDGESTITSGSRTWSTNMALDASDYSYPKLRLGQPTTPEVASGAIPAGSFILQGHKPVKEVTLIPVMGTKAREYSRNAGREKLCVSADAVYGKGIGQNEANPHGECALCPYSQWSGAQGDRKPPVCNLIFSYIAYCLEFNQLVIIEFKKTGTSSAKMINTAIRTNGFCGFALRVGSQSNLNAQKQTYYTHIVTFADLQDPAAYEMARKLAS